MKFLNIDSLLQEPRKLVINGKEYAVKEMSVEDFIQANLSLEKLSKVGENSHVSYMEENVKTVKRAIPELEDSVIRSLSLKQLVAVLEFIRNDDSEESTADDKVGKKK